jgi:hypothetical protein
MKTQRDFGLRFPFFHNIAPCQWVIGATSQKNGERKSLEVTKRLDDCQSVQVKQAGNWKLDFHNILY